MQQKGRSSLPMCICPQSEAHTGCVCVCVLLFLGFARVWLTSDSTRSAPDIAAPLLLVSTPPLACYRSVHPQQSDDIFT